MPGGAPAELESVLRELGEYLDAPPGAPAAPGAARGAAPALAPRPPVLRGSGSKRAPPSGVKPLPQGTEVLGRILRSSSEEATVEVLAPPTCRGLVGTVQRRGFPVVTNCQRMYATLSAGEQLPPPERLVLREGLVVPLAVVAHSPEHGALLLARRDADAARSWQRVRQVRDYCAEHGEALRLRMLKANGGGVLTRLEGVEVFVPLKDVTVEGFEGPVDADIVQERLVGAEVPVTIVKEEVMAGRGGRRTGQRQLIGSCRAARDLQAVKELRPGCLVRGHVKSVAAFGVFVEIEGTSAIGLVHISDISRSFVDDVEALFEVGAPITAIVTVVSEDRKINLSTAELEASRGDMLTDPAAVYAGAEEQAVHFREYLAGLEVEEAPPLGEGEGKEEGEGGGGEVVEGQGGDGESGEREGGECSGAKAR